MKSTQGIITEISKLGLSTEESTVFFELLREPQTHLALSESTGINRTKVYRIVQTLEQLSLITKQTDDRGTFLTATDSSALEMLVTQAEEVAMERRGALQKLMPRLHAMKAPDAALFTTRAYDGIEGLKQMCWHELKAKGELYAFGGGAIEELVPSRHWSEKHRMRSTEAGYRLYEIINEPSEVTDFTNNETYLERYQCRILPSIIARFENQTVVYNDTVAIYHWRDDQKSGIEIINHDYANMMRQMFQHFWNQATPYEQYIPGRPHSVHRRVPPSARATY